MQETVRYTYRVRPGANAVSALMNEWHMTRFLWNESVTRMKAGETVSFAALGKMLTAKRAELDWLRAGSQNAQQMMLRTFSQTYQHSFKVKGRGKPQYKARRKTLPSLEFTTRGFSIKDGVLHLPKGITAPVVWHRDLPSDPTSVRIYQDAVGHWWASFVVRRDLKAAPIVDASIGIDWGVKAVATTTDPAFDLPASGKRRKVAAQLANAQRRMARRHRKGVEHSNGYKRARREAAILQRHAANQVKHDANVWAKRVVDAHDLIAVEDFKPKFLSKTRMARKAADNAVAQTKRLLIEKAERAGRTVVIVPPAYTTMTCSNCGTIAKTRLSLSERTFRCECGYTADRDLNAAQTILALAEVNQVGVDGVSRPERTPVLDGAT